MLYRLSYCLVETDKHLDIIKHIEAASDAAAQIAADAITNAENNPTNIKLYMSGSEPGEIYPSSATDNAIVKWDGTSGKKMQNSGVTIDDSNNIYTPGSISAYDVSVSNYLNVGCQCIYDNAGCLTFYDSYAGSKTLSDLAGGGSSLWYDSGSVLCPTDYRGLEI